MPKRVNREERRQRIAEAVLRLMASRGLEAVRLRDVAAEGGVSMGQVQHYFATKDQMLRFACEYMVEQTNRHVAVRMAELPGPHTIRALLRTAFDQMLPLDAERKAGIRVWMAFLARAVVQPELEQFMRETWIRSHAFFAGQLKLAQDQGELPPDLDPDREAVKAFALVDGLVSHVLVGHYSNEQALAAVDDYLDSLFGEKG